MADVAVVGIGAMGSAVARAHAAAGSSVGMWNRTPGRVDRFIGPRLTGFSLLDDLIGASPVIVCCLTDYDVTTAVLERHWPRFEGRLLVQTATGTPEQAARLGELVCQAGGRYLEAAILGYPESVGTAACHAVFSGPVAAVAEFRAHAAAWGGPLVHLGADIKLAKVHIEVVSTYFNGAVAGLVEALAMAAARGLPSDRLTGSLHDLHATLDATLDSVLVPGYAEPMPLASFAVMVRRLAESAAECGIRSTFLPALRDLADRAIRDGHGGDDFTALVATLLSQRE